MWDQQYRVSERLSKNGVALETWQLRKDMNNLWELKIVPAEHDHVNLLFIILNPDKGSVVSPAAGIDCKSVGAIWENV